MRGFDRGFYLTESFDRASLFIGLFVPAARLPEREICLYVNILASRDYFQK